MSTDTPLAQDPGQITEFLDAVIFDTDGVITRTATVHAAAWKAMFDPWLQDRSAATGGPFAPFTESDYLRYVDGKARVDGVESFLGSRGIILDQGDPDDPPERDTLHGLGARKDRRFLEVVTRDGVRPYRSTLDLVRRLRVLGVRTAAISASRNAATVLAAAGAEDLFDVRVDGNDAAALGLAGKPDPAIFLEAARRLGVDPDRAAVVEDALAGVEAGRRGGFGLVVGVARGDRAGDLSVRGAHIVVRDVGQLHVDGQHHWRIQDQPTPADVEPARHDHWFVEFSGTGGHEVGRREALGTVGNGYFATRACGPEQVSDGIHHPGTYVAGVYNRLRSTIDDQVVENESIVNTPNWLALTARTETGPWLGEAGTELLADRYELDLFRGVLRRWATYRDNAGRVTSLTERRFVSMRDAHLAVLETTVTPENWSGTLEIRSRLDASVCNDGVARYDALDNHHLADVTTRAEGPDVIAVVATTSQSRVRVAEAARTRVARNGAAGPPAQKTVCGDDGIAHEFKLDVDAGDQVVVGKIVAIYTSRDEGISEPLTEACDAVAHAPFDIEELLERHCLAWRHLWGRARLRLGIDDATERLLHLHLFHLLQTVSVHSIGSDVGVPARGLHGEAYRGHIFWDELFVFPFLSLRFPQLTRALLLYRYRRLDQARRAATAAGYRGAMFPWQSGSNGREETQTRHLNPQSGRWLPDASHLQRHVNAAMAVNVWQYYQATGDDDFLASYGAELILEIARFWADIATFDHALGRYEIKGVMGPDEFHEGYPDRDEPGLDNNAYTNLMAVWCLCRAFDVLARLPPHSANELTEKLGLTENELDHWGEVSRHMRVCFHEGVLSQFEGYGELIEFDWDGYRSRYGDIRRLDRILEGEGDRADRYQITKQADVLMLFYVLSADEIQALLERLGYGYDCDLIPRCIDYYRQRTSHGSTLSRVVLAWVNARSDRAASWNDFVAALHGDMDDQGGTTAEGIHLGAMAGTIDLLQRCYPGFETRDDVLRLHPVIPEQLRSLTFDLHYRGHLVHLTMSPAIVQVRLDQSDSAPITVEIEGGRFVVRPGETIEVPLPATT